MSVNALYFQHETISQSIVYQIPIFICSLFWLPTDQPLVLSSFPKDRFSYINNGIVEEDVYA